eukprot:751697-Hanusia_phi.AAC.3
MRREEEAPQMFQFNITIRLEPDQVSRQTSHQERAIMFALQNEMVFYIPPKDSAHPRILHHLVTPRQQTSHDVQRCYSRTCSAQVRGVQLSQPSSRSQPGGSDDVTCVPEAAGIRGADKQARLPDIFPSSLCLMLPPSVWEDEEKLRSARFLVARHFPTRSSAAWQAP